MWQGETGIEPATLWLQVNSTSVSLTSCNKVFICNIKKRCGMLSLTVCRGIRLNLFIFRSVRFYKVYFFCVSINYFSRIQTFLYCSVEMPLSCMTLANGFGYPYKKVLTVACWTLVHSSCCNRVRFEGRRAHKHVFSCAPSFSMLVWL